MPSSPPSPPEPADAPLLRLAHRLVAVPLVYDLVQLAAGLPYVHHRLKRRLRSLAVPDRVADFGGGTGLVRRQLASARSYLCLDLDRRKLLSTRERDPGSLVLQGDATRVPLRSGCAGMVVVTSFGHHLEDAQVEDVLREARRVLCADGLLIFLEPIWSPRRWPSRLLWRYDRGRHPRSAEAWRDAITRHFDVRSWEQFAVFHAYVLVVARARGASG